jgi:hypothetical protein
MLLFFVYFSYFITYIHSITFIQYIYASPFAEASLHFLIAGMLSGKDLPVVPSRESNSNLPYTSRRTNTNCATPHHIKQKCSLSKTVYLFFYSLTRLDFFIEKQLKEYSNVTLLYLLLVH